MAITVTPIQVLLACESSVTGSTSALLPTSKLSSGRLRAPLSRRKSNQLALFAYPGQSNMTGRRLPLAWPRLLRESRPNAYTLLDAAALSTCTQLELDRDQPDFTAVSFHKIFGMPDIGALIVRKASAHVLQKL
jgi:selenocysteine lyase/cysteine desulfurase